jgi:hypothetical protein
VAERKARVVALEALVSSLQAALAKSQRHFGNSSKPPSSDIVKPRKLGKKGRRRNRKIKPCHRANERWQR